MKKIVLLLVATLMIACVCEVIPDEDVHYVNEDFVLIEKEEKVMVIDGSSKNVRYWKIKRLKETNDTAYLADIDDGGCGCGIITDELWYNRNVGDVLHFDYIRKSRFYNVSIVSYEKGLKVLNGEPETKSEPITEPESTPAVINMNQMEIERKILEKERELMGLEREIEQLKESMK